MRILLLTINILLISTLSLANNLFKFSAIYLDYLNREKLSLRECKALSKMCLEEKDEYLCKLSVDLCLKSGYRGESLLTAGKAARKINNSSDIWYIYGRLLLINNRIEEAIKAFEKSIDLNPKNTAPYGITIKVLIFEKRFKEALKLVKKLENNNPKEPKVLIFKGLILESQGKTKEAKRFIEDYLSRNPEDQEALEIASRIYMKLGEYKKASETLEKLVELGRITDNILKDLIEAYINSEQYGKAIHILERIAKFHATGNIYNLLEVLYLKTGKIEKAREICSKQKAFPCLLLYCLEGQETTVVNIKYEDLVNAAQLALELDKTECAIKLFQKALILKPKSPEIYRILSSIYSQILKPERALKNIDAAIALDPDNTDYLFQKCVVLERAGKIEASISCLNAVVSKQKDPTYLNYLGYMLIVTEKDVDRGIKLVKEALKKRPHNPSYIDSLAWGYFKKGEFKKAEKLQREAFNKMKDNPVIVFHLAEILYRLNKRSEAKKLYKLCKQLLKGFKDISPWERKEIEERLKQLGYW